MIEINPLFAKHSRYFGVITIPIVNSIITRIIFKRFPRDDNSRIGHGLDTTARLPLGHLLWGVGYEVGDFFKVDFYTAGVEVWVGCGIVDEC